MAGNSATVPTVYVRAKSVNNFSTNVDYFHGEGCGLTLGHHSFTGLSIMSEYRNDSEVSGNDNQPPDRTKTLVIGLMGLVAVAGALIWAFSSGFFGGSDGVVTPLPPTQPPPIVAPPRAEEADAPAREPAYTPEPPSESTVLAEPDMTVQEANQQLADQLGTLNLSVLATQFTNKPNTIERAMAVVDSMRRGEIPYKLLPLAPPKQTFPFLDSGTAVTLDPAGFTRFDGLLTILAELNIPLAIELFRDYQPVLQASWSALGYANNDVEKSLLNVLELILLTPELPTDARLIKDEGNWIYEDETLEALPALQKQLLRMGPNNAEQLRSLARDLRGALLDSQ